MFYKNLLTIWCDKLISLQIKDSAYSGLYGGILCPCCSRVHGRSWESVYPFMTMARLTGREKYLDAAVAAMKWSRHVSCHDGSFINDTNSEWKAVTVFGAIALGEALKQHGSLLPPAIYAEWMARFAAAIGYIQKNIRVGQGNINYCVSASYAFHLAGCLTEDQKYADLAQEYAHSVLNYMTPDHLIFGEGTPQNGVSEKGCRPIDIVYNMAETLPLLTMYALDADDAVMLKAAAEALEAHAVFFLPDGGIDNSFGTRNSKWTYYGGRTTDGAEIGYALLANRRPGFAELASQNARLLHDLTFDGLLYGGPHFKDRGELPCVHHTFCSAKAMAILCDYHAPYIKDPAFTPRETAEGLRYFRELDTYLINYGGFLATVTAYDFDYYNKDGHAAGGALSMLYHRKAGALCAASQNTYTRVEPDNMQWYRDAVRIPLTPSVTVLRDGVPYRSISYKAARQTAVQTDNAVIVTVQTELCDKEQNTIHTPCTLKYIFTVNKLRICALLPDTAEENAHLLLPVIAGAQDELHAGTAEIIIKKQGVPIRISSAARLFLPYQQSRVFNHVPGFSAWVIAAPVRNNAETWIEIAVGA